MASLGVVASLSQSLIFIGYDLIGKRLREQGASAHDMGFIMRLALWPALVVLAFTWDSAVALQILTSPMLYWPLIGTATCWLVYQWVYFRSLNMAHSLAVVSVTRNAIGLPLLMGLGFLVNGDIPTWWGVTSIGLIICAAFIRPGRTRMDRIQYLESLKAVLGLTVAFIALTTVKDLLYRIYLHNTSAPIFEAAWYSVVLTGGLYVYYFFKPRVSEYRANSVTMWAFVSIWIIGVIPEAIAFQLVPVYAVIAIGTISWVIIILSDLYFKRLAYSWRTALFALTIVTSIVCAIIERQ